MSCEIFILFRCLERCNIYWNGITVLYHYSSPGGGGGGGTSIPWSTGNVPLDRVSF